MPAQALRPAPPSMVRRLVRALAAAALAWLGAFAAPGDARAQLSAPLSPANYYPPLGYRTKEFTFVRDQGWFHVFYIRENLIHGAPTEQSLGHAISRDLYHWAELDTILPVIPGTYEGTQIWAPSLHKVDGTWHMFYPAMREEPAEGYHLAQWITDATSTDLVNWTRRDTPLFDNSIFPWSYYDTTITQGRDCRDPFLWWDATRGEWLLYVATRPAWNPASMIVGIAGSTDLEHWEDRGWVPITGSDQSFSDVAESPMIATRDGAPLLLVWTTNSGNALTYGKSMDAVEGWNTPRRLRSMLGYSTFGWWATEWLVDGSRTYFATVHDMWIDFWDVHWTAADTFQVYAPDSLQVLAATFDRDEVVVGDSAEVVVAAVNGAGRDVGLAYGIVQGTDVDTVDALAAGLPETVTLGDGIGTTRFAAPASLGDGRPYLLTVAPRGGTAESDTIRVGIPDPVYDDPPLEPELPVRPFRVALIPHSGEARFIRDAGTGPWEVTVVDVRGRALWRGAADDGRRTLVWRFAESSGARGAGIAFARLTSRGRPPVSLKVPLVAAGR